MLSDGLVSQFLTAVKQRGWAFGIREFSPDHLTTSLHRIQVAHQPIFIRSHNDGVNLVLPVSGMNDGIDGVFLRVYDMTDVGDPDGFHACRYDENAHVHYRIGQYVTDHCLHDLYGLEPVPAVVGRDFVATPYYQSDRVVTKRRKIVDKVNNNKDIRDRFVDIIGLEIAVGNADIKLDDFMFVDGEGVVFTDLEHGPYGLSSQIGKMNGLMRMIRRFETITPGKVIRAAKQHGQTLSDSLVDQLEPYTPVDKKHCKILKRNRHYLEQHTVGELVDELPEK